MNALPIPNIFRQSISTVIHQSHLRNKFHKPPSPTPKFLYLAARFEYYEAFINAFAAFLLIVHYPILCILQG